MRQKIRKSLKNNAWSNKKLAVYALEQVPCILLPTAYNYSAWWPWVQNFYGEFYAGAMNSGPIYARVWIDQEMKKKMGY